jgi:deferrochelatase/peroxidase EfeB
VTIPARSRTESGVRVPSAGSTQQLAPSQGAGDDCRLQEGIYFRRRQRPGRCFRLLLLNIHPGASRTQAKGSITKVWEGVQTLRNELVADLRPPRLMAPSGSTPDPPDPKLTCLLGFGAALFERYPELGRPHDLVRIDRRAPLGMLGWVDEPDRAIGEAHLALQLIAESELAVSRAVAETWMLIKSLKLDVVALHGGFNREDRRSWLGFHDGIGNIEPDRRREAIETRVGPLMPEDPPWMDGGTYMGFLRLAIDLEMWRGLSRQEQEICVGRDLENGCPVMRIDKNSKGLLDGCPASHGLSAVDYRDPPLPPIDLDNLAQFSHVNRANLNRRRGPIADSDNRIFRQGYEFLECLPGGRLRLGVNFVSFQRKVSCLTTILTRDGWLGDANFGGKPSPTLLRLIGGGYYAVPPAGGPFPGADIF